MTEDPIVDAAPVAAAAPPAAPEAPPPARELTVSQRSMALVKSSLKEFDAVEAGLAKLRKKYENVVFDVSTTKGMKQATEARMSDAAYFALRNEVNSTTTDNLGLK